jgi:arylsulfatase A-like enzyme
MKHLFIIPVLWLCCAANAAPRPNLIFFLSDDHRWDRLGCAGHPILKTPNLDRLAAEGARFPNMFVTTSICAASRASIFTGLHERTHGYTFRAPPISETHVKDSYPVRLRAAGYRTGFIGKYGVGVPKGTKEKMFDSFHAIGRHPYLKKQPDGTTRHETELCGDAAVEFLKSNPKGKSFCLSVSFNASHAEDGDRRPGIGHFPWPKAVDGLYEDAKISAPRLSDPKIFEAHPEFMKQSINRDRWFWRWDTPEKYQVNVRAYYRMISGFDNTIGRVLGELKKMGLAENTVIIFSGDNGYYEGQRGFAGKWSHYEESLRVPLIIHDPRAPKKLRGKLPAQMALNLDIPATILNYAGVKIPEGYQGRSLVPLMRGESPKDWRTDTFCEHLMHHAEIPKWEGVRGPRFVYSRYFEQNPVHEYLHDLKTDPDQLKNLATNPKYAKQLATARKRTDELRESYGGKFDLQRILDHLNRGKKKPKKK